MIVVSDTTPLITLMKINKLDLLRDLFNEVLIPEAVFSELVKNETFYEEAEVIKSADYIKVVRVSDTNSVLFLQNSTGLDLGESEAIAYSAEIKADLLMIDESSGRNVAKQMEIPIIGTLGILSLANSKGIFLKDEAIECIKTLKEHHRHISDQLYQLFLHNLI